MDISKIVFDRELAERIAKNASAIVSGIAGIKEDALEFVARLPEEDITLDDIPAIVKQGRDLYSEFFHDDHNARAYFGDVITLALAENMAVSFERKRGKEIEEVHTTAEQAINLSKHDLRKAASEVRSELGMGRKSGGGRKPRTPEAKSGTAKNLTTSAKSAIENLLKSEAGIQALREILKAQGYQLRKAAK